MSSKSSSLSQDVNRFADWKVGERYKISKILGKGSYGQVAQAVDAVTGNTIAIKRMSDIFHDAIDAKRAYREMHILR
jgi:mitogen-activated protein kinase 1/3